MFIQIKVTLIDFRSIPFEFYNKISFKLLEDQLFELKNQTNEKVESLSIEYTLSEFDDRS